MSINYLFHDIDVEQDRDGKNIFEVVKTNLKAILAVNHFVKEFKTRQGKKLEVIIKPHRYGGHVITIKFPYRTWWYRHLEIHHGK